MPSPIDPDVVAAALAGWLAHRFDGPVAVVGTPGANAGGFDSAIYYVQYAGATLPAQWQHPLVIRIKPAARGDQGGTRPSGLP